MTLESWVSGLIRWRIIAASLALALVLGASSLLPHLRFDLSILPLLQGDPEAQGEVERYYEKVPPRRFDLVCVLSWPHRMGAAEIEQLAEFGRRLAEESCVEGCFSLADVKLVDRQGLLPQLVPLAEMVGEQSVQDTVRGRRLLEGRLLSRDGRSAAVMVRATTGLEGDLAEDFLPRVLDRAPELCPEGVELRHLGRGSVEQALKTAMRSDIAHVLVLQVVVLALLLPVVFRSLRGVLIPLVVILSAAVFDLACMVLLDLPFSIVDTAIPGLVTIIGMCDAVHLIHRFEESFDAHRDRRRALVEALRGVGPACVATSVTTALGFLSLLVASHPAVRDFGMKACIGVLLTLVAVLSMVPLGLALWPVRRPRLPLQGRLRLRYGRPRLTAAIAAGVCLVSALGVARADVDSRWLEELQDDHPVAQSLAWYEQHFGGLQRLDVRLEGELRDPEVVAALERLQQRILLEPGVTGVESYLDWLREAAGNPEELDASAVRQGWMLLSLAGDDFPTEVLSREGDVGRMLFRTTDIGSDRYFELEEAVAAAAASLPAGVVAEADGHASIAHTSNRLVVTTMMESFLISLVTITLFIALIFRSWRMGLISLVPNLLPIFVGLGLTGLLDMPLRIGIAMIFSLGLGLAVDDSIHLLTRYRQERAAGRDGRGASAAALRSTGVALVMTSAVLVLGALCYLPSEFRSMRDVGILLSAMVSAALVADLWLLPHLLERFGEPEPTGRRETRAS